MININELRIGNTVNFSGTCTVISITSTEFIETGYYRIAEHELILKNEKGEFFTVNCNNENLSGIELTEDIVKRYGWAYYNSKTEGDLTMDTYCKIDCDFIDGEIKIKGHYESNYRDIRNIKFLHQLQNLFFILDGKEIIESINYNKQI